MPVYKIGIYLESYWDEGTEVWHRMKSVVNHIINGTHDGVMRTYEIIDEYLNIDLFVLDADEDCIHIHRCEGGVSVTRYRNDLRELIDLFDRAIESIEIVEANHE